MDHGQVVHYHCVTFHLKSVQVVEEEAVEEQVAQYRVHLIEVFIEVFLLAIQNPVDGPRLVVKLFVSVSVCLTVTLMQYGDLNFTVK